MLRLSEKTNKSVRLKIFLIFLFIKNITIKETIIKSIVFNCDYKFYN